MAVFSPLQKQEVTYRCSLHRVGQRFVNPQKTTLVDQTEYGRIHRIQKNLIDGPEFMTPQTACQTYDGKQ